MKLEKIIVSMTGLVADSRMVIAMCGVWWWKWAM